MTAADQKLLWHFFPASECEYLQETIARLRCTGCLERLRHTLRGIA